MSKSPPFPQQTYSSQSESHHLCFVPKSASGLVKQGWQQISRPLLARACHAPIDRSVTSECCFHHSGYFKHIIRPTVDRGPECTSPLYASSAATHCRWRSEKTFGSRWLVCDVAVSLGTLGRFLGKGKADHYSNGKNSNMRAYNDCEDVD